jgi:hypothetical protein
MAEKKTAKSTGAKATEDAPATATTTSKKDPYASGDVSVSALRIGSRDNESVRRLQYALAKEYPGSVNPTGNYQSRTAALVARALDDDTAGSVVTAEQAKKIMGTGYKYVD